MTFALGYVAGVVSTLLLLAFFMGAFRRTPAEQAADDLDQARALGWQAYEEHA